MLRRSSDAVSGWGSNRALVIDTVTDRVIGEVRVAQPHNGTLSRDGRTGWVASQQQGATALVRLDLTTGVAGHAVFDRRTAPGQER